MAVDVLGRRVGTGGSVGNTYGWAPVNSQLGPNPYSQWVTPEEAGNSAVNQRLAGGGRALTSELLDSLIGGTGSLGQLSPEQVAQINEGIQAYMKLAGSATQDAYSQALGGAAARGNLGGTFEADIGQRMAEGMGQNALQATLYGNDLRNQNIAQQMQAYQLMAGLLGQQQNTSNQSRQISTQWAMNQANQPSAFQQLLGGVSAIGGALGGTGAFGGLAGLFGGGGGGNAQYMQPAGWQGPLWPRQQ